MRIRQLWATMILLGVTIIGILPACAQQGAPAAKLPPGRLNIVFIGDSNTELGMVTGSLARALENKYGYSGSGWRSLVDEVGNGRTGAYTSHLLIKNEGPWKKLHMVPQGDRDAFLSPAGTALQGEDPAAVTTVQFRGRAIEVYYLSRPGGGSFAAALDGGPAQTVHTAAADAAAPPVVARHTLRAAGEGEHVLTLRPGSGTVTLLGVDAVAGPETGRAGVVHKWGRSFAETRHFLGIPSSIWRSGLQLVDPDTVVVMLGTNDHNISGLAMPTYLSNVHQLVARIREAVPGARIVVLSTIPAGGWPSVQLGESYARELPRLAGPAGFTYFDVWNWAGSPKAVVEKGLAPAKETIHWGPEGGEQLAAALLPELEKAQRVMPVQEALTRSGNPAVTMALQEAIPAGILAQIPLWLSADGPMDLDATGRVANWHNARAGAALPRAEQPVPQWRPRLVRNAINELPALDFDGRSNLLWLPGNAGLRAYTVVVRARKPGGALFAEGRTMFRQFGSGGKERAFFAPEVLEELKKRGGMAYVNGGPVPPEQLEYPTGEFQIITVDPGGHGSLRLLGHNLWFQRYTREPLELSAWWDGEIAEVVLMSNVFDAARRQAVEGYLSRKYNITLVPAA